MNISGLIGLGVTLLVIYLIFNNSPWNPSKKIELEQSYIDQRIENNRLKLANCLDEVDQRIRNDAISWCHAGATLKDKYPGSQLIKYSDDCYLPVAFLETFAKDWEKDKKEGREECYKLYPQ